MADDYLRAYEYQWNDVLIPYWRRAAAYAREHGVHMLGLEMHPGMAVYNPETLLRLRDACGPEIGCNLDPSHLFWQGIDIRAAVEALKDCIYHVHAKDNAVNDLHVTTNGVLSARHYNQFPNRPWTFRTVGYGHGAQVWKQFIGELCYIGYDGVISIEHEDALISRDEGLTRAVRFLKEICPKEQPSGMWWA